MSGETAYTGNTATGYDERRFSSAHGKLIDKLETCELERATSRLEKLATILEVGCGTSRFSLRLAGNGFRVIGVDPSAEMLEVSRTKRRLATNPELVQADGASLPFPSDTFDCVFAIRLLNQLRSEADGARIVEEMIRVSKPNGLVLVEFANKDRPFAKRSKAARFSFDQVRSLVEQNGAQPIEERGVFVLSMALLQRVPTPIHRYWEVAERTSAWLLHRAASRGYVLAKKCTATNGGRSTPR